MATNVNPLPCSIDSEKALLCSLLLNPYEVDWIIRSRLMPESFYVPEHQEIYRAISEMLSARKPLEFPALKEELKAKGMLEEIGGKEYLAALYGFVPTWENAQFYADRIREKELLRKSVLVAMQVQERALQPNAEFADVRNEIEKILTNLSMQVAKPERDRKTITLDWLDALAARAERLKETGFFFGVPSLDRHLGAIRPGDYVVVSAETSGGKSLLAFQGALHAATKGMATAAFSFEMSFEQLWDRMFAYLARVSMNSFRGGLFTEEEYKRLHDKVPRFIDLPLYVEDTRDNDIASIASRLRRLKTKHGVKVAVVDYLQRVRPSTVRKDGARYLEVGEVSDRLKSLALELEIVMIVPVQLNRDGQTRETASIEHDADVHIKIVEEKESARTDENDVVVWVEKNRQGRRHFPIKLRLDGEFMTLGERTNNEI